jgi:uncharacterized iron-regulated membrane protein
MAARRLYLRLHRIVGLAAGACMLALGATGAILAFDNIASGSDPPQGAGAASPSAAAIVRALDAVGATLPGAEIVRIALPQTAGDDFVIVVAEPDASTLTVRSDVATGAVLDIVAPGFIDAVRELHATLFVDRVAGPETGRYVAGAIGCLGAVLTVVGVVLWWTGHRKKAKQLKIYVGGNWKRSVWDLHSVAGIVAALPLFALCVTGAIISFKGFAAPEDQMPAGRIGYATPSAAASSFPAKSAAGLDRLLKAAEAALPGGRITEILVPRRTGEPLRIRKRLPDDPFRRGQSSVALDSRSAAVVQIRDGRNASGDTLADRWLKAVHSGSAGGTAGAILVGLSGAVTGVLVLTGVVLWLNRRKAWRHIAEAARAFLGPPAKVAAARQRTVEERLAALEAAVQQLLAASRDAGPPEATLRASVGEALHRAPFRKA